MPMRIEQARQTFFAESVASESTWGLAMEGWRGAVLYRGKYDWHAMPRLLWEALRTSGGRSRWWICGYAEKGELEPPAISFSFEWDGFLTMSGNPARESSEWVAYNDEQIRRVRSAHRYGFRPD